MVTDGRRDVTEGRRDEDTDGRRFLPLLIGPFVGPVSTGTVTPPVLKSCIKSVSVIERNYVTSC